MKRSNKTLRLIYLIALIVIVTIIVNVFLVTIGKVHMRSKTSLDSYMNSVSTVSETVYANRGNIFDTNGQVIAQDVTTYDIICYLDSSRIGNGKQIAYVDDPLYTANVLASFLDMEAEEIYDFLTAHPNWYQTELGVKGRGLSKETAEAILEYPGIHGIGFRESASRIYPQGSNMSPYLVGYAQVNNDTGKLEGKMGVEKYLDEELSGIDGNHTYQMSKQGYILPGMYEEYTPAKSGYDVYLTLDTSIQEALEDSFVKIKESNNAEQAWGSVMEIKTGKILAWGQTPSFDPNVLDVENWNNIGSMWPYEPGSVFKSIIYAAAMDLGVYDGQKTFNSDTYCFSWNGNTPYRVYPGSGNYDSSYCITNANGKSWGNITLDYGLIYSSNVATMTLLENYVGTQNFIDYVYKFGFFDNVESDGLEDVQGVKNYVYPIDKLSLTFGQGSSVTMLQLLQAYSAIFGNGEMITPYYIDKVVDPDTNEIVYQGERKVAGTPIKESTAKQMQELLAQVVYAPGGTAQYYAVDETTVMGKTGTAQVSLLGEGYSEQKTISSVMMAFPVENPQYILYYAYLSPYNYYNHLNADTINDFTRRVAILTDVSVNRESTDSTDKYEKFIMANYQNVAKDKAVSDLYENGVEVVIIGDGNQVIGQYPKSGDSYYKTNKVFLLTDGNDISIPDFTGYSRADIMHYWDLSKLSITIDGYGVVYDQSMPPYSIVNSDDELILYLYDIKTDDSKNIDESYIE